MKKKKEKVSNEGRDNKHWVRKDYEEFVKTVTSSWPEWKKAFLTK